MRVTTIPLEKIADHEYRVPYARAAEMMNLNGTSAVVNELFADQKVKPWEYVSRFNLRHSDTRPNSSGYFTADEMGTINDRYSAFNGHKIANAKFSQEGYRRDLIDLLKRISNLGNPLTRITNGCRSSLIFKIRSMEEKLLISPSFFDSVVSYVDKFSSSESERLKANLRMLKDIFVVMLNTAGLVAETGEYYGAD